MRLRRLDIPAYGPFTDLTLDFSTGTADFHVIYGRNEAGKSSLLRAIRDLLYGIHTQTADNFLHDYKNLRLSAEIENRAGRRLALQRRKGKVNTLLDASGNTLDETVLAPFLGPVDREFFTTMFGLGADELRQGAHDLLQGKGDLGRALFSASLAGTPIHHVLEKLDDEARTLFNGRSRVGVSLRPAIEVYEEALRDSRQSQIKAETWEETLSELDTARQAKAGLDADLHTRRARQDWLRRCLDALPTLGRLRETDARLNALPILPLLPDGFAEAAETARHTLLRVEQGLSELRQRINELRARRDTLAPRADVLARAVEIDVLIQGLAAYRKDREALAADKAEASQMQARLRTGLLDLGLQIEPADIAELRLTLGEQQALRDAASTLLEMERAADAQGRERERLTVELEKIGRQLARLQQTEVAALREAQTASARAAVTAQTLADKEAILEGLYRRLLSQQRLLPGAPEDVDAAYAMVLPAAARLREFEAMAAAQATRAHQLEEASQSSAKRHRELQSKLQRLEKRGALPSQADLNQARELRESGWCQVLLCWKDGVTEPDWEGAPLAESYPAAVRHVDALADHLREEADAVAQAEELRAQIAEIDTVAQEQREEERRLQQARQAWQRDWSDLWQPAGLVAASPGEMLEWREQWIEFRNRYEAWRELHEALQAGRQDIAAAEQLLCPLLGVTGQPLLALRALADSRLSAADQEQGERRTRLARQDELRTEHEALERQTAALDTTLAEAQTHWREHRLGGENRPENALGVLTARLELVAQYDAWTRLSATLAEKQATVDVYERQAQVLTHELNGLSRIADPAGITNDSSPFSLKADFAPAHDTERRGPPPGMEQGQNSLTAVSPEVQVNALRAALSQARTLQDRRNQVEEDLQQLLANQPHVEQEVESAQRDMVALLAQANVADQPALLILLADLVARQRLTSERDNLRSALHVQARGEALDSFIERVHAENSETSATEVEELAALIREMETQRERAIQALVRAEDAKAHLEASGANAAEHLQNARHAAAHIRLDAARYLRLRLATQFLQTQIETFRERNQGPLLAKAGELFKKMTRASFSGLGTDYALDDTPTLVGLKEGVTIPVEGMSEGTRDQLYLALRLAAIESHQANHEPMPLILDDLLITFDDDRTRAILPLLHDLAGKTQVLLFTHHRHLLDLVREILPPECVCLHEL